MSNRPASPRSYSAKFKCKIMHEHLVDSISGPELRAMYDVKKNTFGAWKHQFLQAGFSRMHKRHQSNEFIKTINKLKDKNRDLENQLSHLQLRNDLLSQTLKYGIEIRKRKRYPSVEKLRIIKIVERSKLARPAACQEIGIDNATYYKWLRPYSKHGYKGLVNKAGRRSAYWNEIPDDQKELVLNMHAQNHLMGIKQLRWHIVDECGVFLGLNIVKTLVVLAEDNDCEKDENPPYHAANSFPYKTSHPHQIWQTDFTKVRLANGRSYYVSAIIDDYSRYIIAHGIYSVPNCKNVIHLFKSALPKLNSESNKNDTRPRILTDRAPYYVTPMLKAFLTSVGMKRVVGKINRPTTRGKIERFFLTLKRAMHDECIRSKPQLTEWIDRYIEFYNNERCHHALDYCRPVDVLLGNKEEIMNKRKEIRVSSPRIRGEKQSEYPTDLDRRCNYN
ncbi:IS3 family transposase [Candidatus Neomarinimicrobiota bacterium]